MFLQVYKTYKILLNKRPFVKVAAEVNDAKWKYFKKCTSAKMGVAERDYFLQYIITILNTLMDVLVVLIQENNSEDKNSLNFINNRWCNLYDLWINSNKETALDDKWIISLWDQSIAKHPKNFKLIYKMFVLTTVIKAEVLRLSLQDYDSLPQYSSLFNQYKR